MGVSAKAIYAPRLGGAVLVLGTLAMIAGAAIPFYAPSLNQAPWTADVQLGASLIAGNPGAYAWASGLFLAAGLITALGLGPVSMAFTARGQPWARMGLVTFVFSAVCSTIDRTISIKVFTWGAVQHLDTTTPLVQTILRFQSGMGQLTHLLAYTAIGLYGAAMLLRVVPFLLGWVFVLGGVAGVAAKVVGHPIPAFSYLGTGALGVAMWLMSQPHELETIS
jgi:hypothetical protein